MTKNYFDVPKVFFGLTQYLLFVLPNYTYKIESFK